MLLKNNSLKVLAHGSLLWTKKLALALRENLEENISAFVSKIRNLSDHDHIEYLHVQRFKLHHKTFVLFTLICKLFPSRAIVSTARFLPIFPVKERNFHQTFCHKYKLSVTYQKCSTKSFLVAPSRDK